MRIRRRRRGFHSNKVLSVRHVNIKIPRVVCCVCSRRLETGSDWPKPTAFRPIRGRPDLLAGYRATEMTELELLVGKEEGEGGRGRGRAKRRRRRLDIFLNSEALTHSSS